MKTIKSILIAATLIGATVVSTMSAQQQAPAQKHEFKVAIGDSVMIKRECRQYCTGETPSVWVWDKVHTVRQLGTKRFADGVLLMNIYSWMCEDCLINVSGHAKEAAAKAAEEQAADRKAFEEGKSLEEIDAEKAAKEAETAAAEEPAEEPVVEEPAPVEEPAEEPAEEEPAPKKAKGGYDRFTIGVRGGVASQLDQAVSDVDAKWGIGGDAILDLQYAHYWTKEGRSTDLGLIVGLGVGYAQGSFKGTENSNFKLGGLDYTITADEIRETDHQLQLEIPLMFSLIHKSGLFFNVGPRFMLPVYTPFNETINGSAIKAYDPETEVTWVDNVITGKYNGEKAEGDNNLQFKFHIMLTAEIGYEWILKSGNSLGLGVYADYSVWNTRPKQDVRKYNSLLDVTAPGNGEIGSVVARPVTDAYAKSTGFFDVGVKLAYHFNFPKKQKAAKAEEAAELAPAEAPAAE